MPPGRPEPPAPPLRAWKIVLASSSRQDTCAPLCGPRTRSLAQSGRENLLGRAASALTYPPGQAPIPVDSHEMNESNITCYSHGAEAATVGACGMERG